MHLTSLHSRSRTRALLAAFLLAVAPLAACSGGEDEAAQKKAENAPPAIEPVPGMKYYVGGPVMRYDKYERLRLGGFNGEVAAPSSRGLLIGYKLEDDGKKFDYRTWINGRAISKANGFLDEDGLLWFSDRETYDSNGKVIARQSFKYDDAGKVMTTVIEQLDANTGAVVNTHTTETPYTPPETPDLLEEDGEGGEGQAPAAGDDAQGGDQ